MKDGSRSLLLAKQYLGKKVSIIMDRPQLALLVWISTQ
jgi:hypothetical protein